MNVGTPWRRSCRGCLQPTFPHAPPAGRRRALVPVLDDTLHDSPKVDDHSGASICSWPGFNQYQNIPVVKHLKNRADDGCRFLGDARRRLFLGQPAADAAAYVKLLKLAVDNLTRQESFPRPIAEAFPDRSFLRSMIAVWESSGHGWRNSAVTANQSANAPTIPPRRRRAHTPSTGTVLRAKATVKMTAMTISSPVASRFMWRSDAALAALFSAARDGRVVDIGYSSRA